MYEFIKDTVNPLAGRCPHDCSYCYVKDLKKRFPAIREKYSGELRLCEKTMKKNLGNGKTLFVCSCNDLFAEDVNSHHLFAILRWLKEYDNTYYFQTKNPGRLSRLIPNLPEKKILCVTLESDRMMNVPTYILADMADACHLQITIEPIREFDLEAFCSILRFIKPAQVNIGANTSKIKLIEPSPEKVHSLISELEKFTKVHLKDNLKRLL